MKATTEKYFAIIHAVMNYKKEPIGKTSEISWKKIRDTLSNQVKKHKTNQQRHSFRLDFT